jgi:hypothetical protein
MEQNRNKQASEQPQSRLCLACHRPFATSGPFLRICQTCKESEEWQSGDNDFAVHTKGAANDN